MQYITVILITLILAVAYRGISYDKNLQNSDEIDTRRPADSVKSLPERPTDVIASASKP